MMPEVQGVLIDVLARNRIAAPDGLTDVSLRFVEAVRHTEAFQPRGGLVFLMRQVNRADNCASAPDDPDDPDERDHYEVEGKKQRVVHRHENKADHCLQQDGEAADQEIGQRLLHDDDVEVAIEQRTHVVVLEERVERVDRSQGYLRDHAGVEASCEQIHQVNTQGVQPACHQQQHEQGDRQHHQWRRQTGVGNRIDQHLHGNRRGERQDADANAIDRGQLVVAGLRREDPGEKREELAQGHFVCQNVVRHDVFLPDG